jgi:hypothetical protein
LDAKRKEKRTHLRHQRSRVPRTAAGDDAREETHALCVGDGEGELAQEGMVADNLGEVGEGADVGGQGYVGILCAIA